MPERHSSRQAVNPTGVKKNSSVVQSAIDDEKSDDPGNTQPEEGEEIPTPIDGVSDDPYSEEEDEFISSKFLSYLI